ncbi:hypothetical protein [Streptomyces sp. NPDC058891]|uniref:hypothetical protein n=1 Tax=Streptomyces sp. NPDC058891 TaxID=3346667 RepID=UPI0036B34DE9
MTVLLDVSQGGSIDIRSQKYCWLLGQVNAHHNRERVGVKPCAFLCRSTWSDTAQQNAGVMDL